jgi:hypothetical protein
MFYVTETILGSSVADGATVNVNYPAGTSRGNFIYSAKHEGSIGGSTLRYAYDFELTLVTLNITVTNRSGATWPAGALLRIGLDQPGEVFSSTDSGALQRTFANPVLLIDFGSPLAAVSNGICVSQSVSANANAVINGTLAASGGVVLDAPRNVVAAWTGTAVVTVRGFDEYGQPMIESSASGASFTGKKAFKRVTRVSFNAAVTLATVGTGNVLGFPVYVPYDLAVARVTMNGAAETAAAQASGDLTKPSATTGDVRGTFTPTNTPNGNRAYLAIVYQPDSNARGLPQFTA